MMRRRAFIKLVGGAAAWPLAARAQQGERIRRIGALMNLAADDPVSIARAKAFTEGLQALGWVDGQNVQIDYRWAASKPDLFQRHAAELATLAPDVILAAGGAALPAVLQATRTIQSVATSLGVDVTPINVRDAAEIERDIAALARTANTGLILTASPAGPVHRDLIIALAARHKLPAVYVERLFVAAGGLLSYGPDFADQYRRAATYVDRIFKGEKPADLPVQAPTKYQLAVNLKTAKTLGLTVPPTLLARADEVIE